MTGDAPVLLPSPGSRGNTHDREPVFLWRRGGESAFQGTTLVNPRSVAQPKNPAVLGGGRDTARRTVPALLRCPGLALLIAAFLALLFLLPPRLVISGLGAAGRPSAVLAFALGLCWIGAWLWVRGQHAGRQPLRWLVGAFFLATLLAYAAGYARGLPTLEASAINRKLIEIFAMCGLALVVADGVRRRGTLDTVLSWLTFFAAIMAVVGIIQAITGYNLAASIDLPGLQSNSQALRIGARGSGDFARVMGTAGHYIEFGVVLAMSTPIALHYALFARGWAQKLWRWSVLGLIAAAIPFAISRSGALALAVSFAVLAVAWTWRMRITACVIGLASLFAFQAIQPGILGTIRSLFTNFDNDPSVQHRLSDYDAVRMYVSQRPLFGRGPGTFLPEKYIVLDNQFLYGAITTGLVGIAAFILLLVGAYWLARSVRLRGADQPTRHLGQALAAAFAVAFISSGVFDSLSFSTFTGTLFLLLGVAGALWRIDRDGGFRELQPAGPEDRVVASPWMARRASTATVSTEGSST